MTHVHVEVEKNTKNVVEENKKYSLQKIKTGLQ